MNGMGLQASPAPGRGAQVSRAARTRRGGRVARTALVSLLCAGALAGSAAAAGSSHGVGSDFVVIVNAANPAAALNAADISKLFLRHSARWPSGERVVAIEMPQSSPVRESFSRAIHHRSAEAVAAYWQTMIFSGRDVPPPEGPSPAAIVSFVGAEAGAIAYLPAGTSLPRSVKVLKVLP